MVYAPGDILGPILAERRKQAPDVRIDILIDVGLLTTEEETYRQQQDNWAMAVGRIDHGGDGGYYVIWTGDVEHGQPEEVFSATVLHGEISFQKYRRGPWERELALLAALSRQAKQVFLAAEVD